jgi:glycosyltransferase involved in cell wall biosynthesis
MHNQKKKISISIPSYNEELSIVPLISELKKITEQLNNYNFEYIFINDGSTDLTLAKIKEVARFDHSIKFIDFSRNFGKEAAMMAGFDFATGDAVITIDADLQHPPEAILEMVKLWEEGYEDIAATRIIYSNESFIKKKFSIYFYKILSSISETQVQRNTGDFRLLDRKCINAIRTLRESNRYTKGLYNWIGFKKITIGYNQNERLAGETKWSFFKLLNLAVNGITSFSVLPLRLATVIGFCVSFFSFAYALFFIVKTILYGESIQGFPTIIISILLFGGLQIFFIGIVGEYLGKIFIEVKKRPQYLVNETNLDYLCNSKN